MAESYRRFDARYFTLTNLVLALGRSGGPTPTAGKALVWGTSGAEWGTPSAPVAPITDVAAGAYSVVASDEVLFVDTTAGTATITLPAPTEGRELRIRHVRGANTITVQRAGNIYDQGAAVASLVIGAADWREHVYRGHGTDWYAE